MCDREPVTDYRLGDTACGPIPCTLAWGVAVTMLILFPLLWGCAGREAGAPGGIDRVRHVIVIYMENWSFDGQFGLFPGANGMANAGDTTR